MTTTPQITPESARTALSVTTAPNYHQAATSDNTRAAYQSDIQHFLNSGGRLPAVLEDLERYLNDSAPQISPRTLIRRMSALRQWHRLQGLSDPTQDPRIQKTIRGIARLHGKPKQQAAALTLKELDRLVAHLSTQQGLLSIRNRALLLVGFFGAFRRSELVAIQWSDIELVSDGMIIRVPRSKTDQTGQGDQCVIPVGNGQRCPVQALIAWREAGQCWQGPVFRQLTKVGGVRDQAISARHWNQLIRQLATEADLPQADQISSHSLRRGFATEAARRGASLPSIQRHGRWRSTKVVLEYIEAGRQFHDSAVNVLFE